MPHQTQPLGLPHWAAPPLVSLIASIGRSDFPEMLLRSIAGIVPADVCGAFRIGAGPAARATCLLTASRMDAATAR